METLLEAVNNTKTAIKEGVNKVKDALGLNSNNNSNNSNSNSNSQASSNENEGAFFVPKSYDGESYELSPFKPQNNKSKLAISEDNELENYIGEILNTRLNIIKTVADNELIEYDNPETDIEKIPTYTYTLNKNGVISDCPKDTSLDKAISQDMFLDGIFDIDAGDYETIPVSTNIDASHASTVHTSIRKRPIEWLCIHYTAGASSKTGRAVSNAVMFGNPGGREASADFIVDDSTQVQYNPDPAKYYCWSVGDNPNTGYGATYKGICRNNNSISIEVCSNYDKNLPGAKTVNNANDLGFYFTNECLAQARNLAMYLMDRYNIPLDHVIRHFDVSGKLCPGIVGWNTGPGSDNDYLWQQFHNSLAH